ncbi:MAG: IS630 family transposase, partial [Paracoccus sp. (in: a-proteobacteria)]
PYAPELNPVENVRAWLRANRLAISVFDTYDDIVARCCGAWNFFANDTNRVRSVTDREYARQVNT